MKKFDFHVHITAEQITVEQSAYYLNDMCARKGYEGIGIIAASHTSRGYHRDCNEKALALEKLVPGSFCFAGLHHDRDFVAQAEEYMSGGFRGIKLLNGKPSEYRHFGYGYENERYDPFFAYCEKYGVPLLIHNNDPLVHWDATRASERAKKMGWVYDETFPPQSWFFEVMEGVLARYPRLKVALAHLGFYDDRLDRAAELLEAYPNLVFDITPAAGIFVSLSKTPQQSEAFFKKYHERLIFGTDASNNLTGESRALNDVKTDMTDTFFGGGEPCTVGKYPITPIRISSEMLEDIYYHNAMRFANIKR